MHTVATRALRFISQNPAGQKLMATIALQMMEAKPLEPMQRYHLGRISDIFRSLMETHLWFPWGGAAQTDEKKVSDVVLVNKVPIRKDGTDDSIQQRVRRMLLKAKTQDKVHGRISMDQRVTTVLESQVPTSPDWGCIESLAENDRAFALGF